MKLNSRRLIGYTGNSSNMQPRKIINSGSKLHCSFPLPWRRCRLRHLALPSTFRRHRCSPFLRLLNSDDIILLLYRHTFPWTTYRELIHPVGHTRTPESGETDCVTDQEHDEERFESMQSAIGIELNYCISCMKVPLTMQVSAVVTVHVTSQPLYLPTSVPPDLCTSLAKPLYLLSSGV